VAQSANTIATVRLDKTPVQPPQSQSKQKQNSPDHPFLRHSVGTTNSDEGMPQGFGIIPATVSPDMIPPPASTSLLYRQSAQTTPGSTSPFRDGVTTAKIVSISCVYMDENTQEEKTLEDIPTPPPHTVATALRVLKTRSPEFVPPSQDCMVCIQKRGSSDYLVVDVMKEGSTSETLNEGDLMYVARMASK
jgi:hypothetical protein